MPVADFCLEFYYSEQNKSFGYYLLVPLELLYMTLVPLELLYMAFIWFYDADAMVMLVV